MKKLVTTLTALVFALGLTASGYTQTTAKPEAKPAVKTETPAAGSQVSPLDKGKADVPAKPATKEGELDKGKKAETQMSKKDADKKPVAPAGATKKEEKKDVIK